MPEELEDRAELMRQASGSLVYEIRKWGVSRGFIQVMQVLKLGPQKTSLQLWNTRHE